MAWATTSSIWARRLKYAVEVFFAGQTGHRRAPAGDLFHDDVGRLQSQAIGAVPMKARGVEPIGRRDLVARFAGRYPPINLRPLDMLASAAFSGHFCPNTIYRPLWRSGWGHSPKVSKISVWRLASRNITGSPAAVFTQQSTGRNLKKE